MTASGSQRRGRWPCFSEPGWFTSSRLIGSSEQFRRNLPERLQLPVQVALDGQTQRSLRSSQFREAEISHLLLEAFHEAEERVLAVELGRVPQVAKSPDGHQRNNVTCTSSLERRTMNRRGDPCDRPRDGPFKKRGRTRGSPLPPYVRTQTYHAPFNHFVDDHKVTGASPHATLESA